MPLGEKTRGFKKTKERVSAVTRELREQAGRVFHWVWIFFRGLGGDWGFRIFLGGFPGLQGLG